jgi:hypothetical protein
MGQLDSTCRAPPRAELAHNPPGNAGHLDVVLQVAFERQTLKPVFLVDRL